MELTYKTIADAENFEKFRALLISSGLPAEGLDFNRDLLLGYFEGDELVGTGGLEIYEPYALLRSLAVKTDIRGKAVGSTITEYLLEEAKKRGLKAIFLLTGTARGFFQRKGFVDVPRSTVPDEVRKSREFAELSAESANVMALALS